MNSTASASRARHGFIAAGIYNLVGILGFTQFFTDTTLMETDPVVFSWVGQIAIILWGLAYLSVSRSHVHVPWLVAVFAIEKLLYAVAWALWLFNNQATLSALGDQSLVMYLFFASYGFGDFLFCIFFATVAFRLLTRPHHGTRD